MFDWLTHLVSGNPWTYAAIFGIAAGDVLFPLPAEGYRRLQRGRGRDVLGERAS